MANSNPDRQRTKTVSLNPRSYEFTNYQNFHDHLYSEPPSSVISSFATSLTTNSLTSILPGDVLVQFNSLESNLRSIFDRALGKWRYDGKPKNAALDFNTKSNLTADLQSLLSSFAAQGVVTSRGIESVRKFLSTLQSRSSTSLSWLYMDLARLLGLVFEDAVVAFFNDPQKGGAFFESSLAEVLNAATFPGSIRLQREYTKRGKPYLVGNRLVDINVASRETGINFTLSLKFTPSTTSPAAISPLKSTTLEFLLNNIARDDKCYYGFYRYFGYMQRVNNDVKAYLIFKNIDQIFIGTGIDAVSDWVINNKFISTADLIRMMAANYSRDLFKIVGLGGQGIPLPDNSRARTTYRRAGLTDQSDKAIRTWIEDINFGRSIKGSVELNLHRLGL